MSTVGDAELAPQGSFLEGDLAQYMPVLPQRMPGQEAEQFSLGNQARQQRDGVRVDLGRWLGQSMRLERGVEPLTARNRRGR